MRNSRRALTAILVGLVLAVTGCGGDDGSSGGEASGTAGGPRCDLAIAFFGAQTGDAANLGINISNGVQLYLGKVTRDLRA